MYPTYEFYYFVCAIEKICEIALSDANQLFYGSSIFLELNERMQDDDCIQQLLRDSFSSCISDDACIQDALKYLLQTYVHRRGKDYASQRIARQWKGPQVGLRQTLATLSNPDNRKTKHRNTSMPKPTPMDATASVVATAVVTVLVMAVTAETATVMAAMVATAMTATVTVTAVTTVVTPVTAAMGAMVAMVATEVNSNIEYGDEDDKQALVK